MGPRRRKVPVPPPPPSPENVVTLEVTGPKSLMRSPVTRKVNINFKLKDVLGKFLGRSKLKGYKATKLKGTLKDSVGLDVRVKDFIDASFRKAPKLGPIRMRLMKRGRTAGHSSSAPAPEIITIDEGDEEVPMAMGMLLDGVLVSVEDVKAELEMPMEEGPEEENDQEQTSAPVASDSQMKQVESTNVSVVATTAPSQPPARVIPDEHQPRPSTSSALREEMALAREKVREKRQEAAPVPPPPTSLSSVPQSVVSGIGKRSVRVKLEAVNFKQEIPDPASTIADLREKGVKIDNLRSLTQKKITQFSNPFLLLVREEIRELQRNRGCPEWQKVVAKAPKCAYMIRELFNDDDASI